MYVTDKDLKLHIRESKLNLIIDHDREVMEQASLTAEGLVALYLNKYDCDAEFALTGTDRNQAVLTFAKHIALYFLYERIDDSQVPDRIIKNYDDAISTLNNIAQDTLQLPIPLKTS